MMQFIVTISELQTRLEGAIALNIFLLHKLGGQVTVTKTELDNVVKDFDTLHFAAQDDTVHIKLKTAERKS